MTTLPALAKHSILPALSAALYYGWLPPVVPLVAGRHPFVAGFVAAFALVVTLPDLIDWAQGRG